MARLQVAGRLRQGPEVVDFERAATFTKPEKRGLERRRLNIMGSNSLASWKLVPLGAVALATPISLF